MIRKPQNRLNPQLVANLTWFSTPLQRRTPTRGRRTSRSTVHAANYIGVMGTMSWSGAMGESEPRRMISKAESYRCDGWFHAGCVGLTKSEIDLIANFYCPSCEKGKLCPLMAPPLRASSRGMDTANNDSDSQQDSPEAAMQARRMRQEIYRQAVQVS
jgi:hypothetical protein